MNIYLLRHGESMGADMNCFVGAADFELSVQGWEQASQLGRRVKEISLQAIFTSPLKRSLQTAETILKEIAMPCQLEIMPALKERNSYGILSGVEKKLAGKIFEDIIAEMGGSPEYSKLQIIGSERFEDFVSRVTQSFQDIIDQCDQKGYQSVMIVGHGKFLETLLVDVLGVCHDFDYTVGRVFKLKVTPAVVNFQLKHI